MNFFVAYGNYVRYCKRAGLIKGEWLNLKGFAELFAEGKKTNHSEMNYAD